MMSLRFCQGVFGAEESEPGSQLDEPRGIFILFVKVGVLDCFNMKVDE